MKSSKVQQRLSIRAPKRGVSLNIRDFQVTVKVKGPVGGLKQVAAR